MLASPSSASAISAALRIAWPAAPAFPLADRGKIRPTLKSPAPRLGADSDAIAAGAAALPRDRSPEFSVPLHPARHVAATSAAAIAVGGPHRLPTPSRPLPFPPPQAGEGKVAEWGRVGRRWAARASDRLRWKAI